MSTDENLESSPTNALLVDRVVSLLSDMNGNLTLAVDYPEF